MTNQEIRQIALDQSAIDCNCNPEDFLQSENVITCSRAHPQARKYLPLPFACDMVSYGSNIVAQTHQDIANVVREYLSFTDVGHAFESPAVHVLDELLSPFDLKVCFMAEYFLPDELSSMNFPVPTNFVFCIRPTFRICIYPNGAMLSVKLEKNWMCWVLVPMMEVS